MDMESIVNSKVVIEENKSPFKSPAKRKRKEEGFGINLSEIRSEDSPLKVERETSKEKRKIENQKVIEEFKTSEEAPPKQHSLLHIKTAVTRYPTINAVSPFSNEEIMEGKRCLLNHYKRTPEAEANRRRLYI